MEKYVLLMLLFLPGHDERHARGVFRSEASCWRYGDLFNAGKPPALQWIGRCMTVRELRRLYPDVEIEEDS